MKGTEVAPMEHRALWRWLDGKMMQEPATEIRWHVMWRAADGSRVSLGAWQWREQAERWRRDRRAVKRTIRDARRAMRGEESP